MKEIKELYKEYINLKNASLSYEDLELQLYYKLIHHIKDNDEHLCDFAEKILSIYGKKTRIKRKKV